MLGKVLWDLSCTLAPPFYKTYVWGPCDFVTSQKSSISCIHSPLVERDNSFLDCSFLDIFILQSWTLWPPSLYLFFIDIACCGWLWKNPENCWKLWLLLKFPSLDESCFIFFPFQVLLVFRYAAVEVEESAWLSNQPAILGICRGFLPYFFLFPRCKGFFFSKKCLFCIFHICGL